MSRPDEHEMQELITCIRRAWAGSPPTGAVELTLPEAKAVASYFDGRSVDEINLSSAAISEEHPFDCGLTSSGRTYYVAAYMLHCLAANSGSLGICCDTPCVILLHYLTGKRHRLERLQLADTARACVLQFLQLVQRHPDFFCAEDRLGAVGRAIEEIKNRKKDI